MLSIGMLSIGTCPDALDREPWEERPPPPLGPPPCLLESYGRQAEGYRPQGGRERVQGRAVPQPTAYAVR